MPHSIYRAKCTGTFVYWMIWGYGNLAISINFKLKFLYYDFHLQKCSMSSLVPQGTWRCYLSAFVYVCMLRFWASLVQSPVQQCSNDLYKLYVGYVSKENSISLFFFLLLFSPMRQSTATCRFSAIHLF